MKLYVLSALFLITAVLPWACSSNNSNPTLANPYPSSTFTTIPTNTPPGSPTMTPSNSPTPTTPTSPRSTPTNSPHPTQFPHGYPYFHPFPYRDQQPHSNRNLHATSRGECFRGEFYRVQSFPRNDQRRRNCHLVQQHRIYPQCLCR